MISKGYHYVIDLGIVSNFYISIHISIDPGSLAKDLSQQVNSGESAFSLLHRFSSPLSTMSFHRAQLEQHLYSLCVLFSPSLSILSIVQFKSPIIILFSFLSFIFCICSPQNSAPSPAVLWCYTLKGHEQRTLSLEGVRLKDTNLSLGSVSTSVIPSRLR